MSIYDTYRVADWYPLLRRLRVAGWEHQITFADGYPEIVFARNRLAVNEQTIAVNETYAGLRIEVRLPNWGASVYGFTPADLDCFAAQLGVFEPAPAPSWPVRRREPVTEDREADRG